MGKRTALPLLIAVCLLLMAATTLVDLTRQVTGVLPVANGGLGVATASANTVAAGPTSGSAAAYSFRSLAGADLPVSSTTVGTGGLFSSGLPLSHGYSSGTTTPTGGTLFVTQFVPTISQPIGHATVDVGTAGTSESMFFCLYNGTGATLLWSASTVVTSTGAATASAAQFTAVAGTLYWIGYVQTGTTAAVMLTYGSSVAPFTIINKNGVRYGTAATAQSSCPSTITLPLTAITTALGDTMIALEP